MLVSSFIYQIQLHELDCVEKCSQHLCRDLESIYKKSSKNATGSRLWDQGITLLIKIQVALLPMGIQCNTLDWIRWWQPRPFVFCAWRDERNLSSAVLLYTQKHVLRNGCELSLKAVADLKMQLNPHAVAGLDPSTNFLLILWSLNSF